MYSTSLKTIVDSNERATRDSIFFANMQKLQEAKLKNGKEVTQRIYNVSFNTTHRMEWLQELTNSLQAKIEKYISKRNHELDSPVVDKTIVDNYNNFISKLSEHQDNISRKLDEVILLRRGITPFAPNYENYLRSLKQSAYSLYFLSSLYMTNDSFSRPEFDEEDFTLICSIYEGNYDANTIIEGFARFLNLNTDEVVLATANSRFSGTEIWMHDSSSIKEDIIQHDSAKYITFDDAVVIENDNENIETFIKSEAFSKINVWVDVGTLNLHVRDKILPLKINRSLISHLLPNTEYLSIIAFDYLDSAKEVDLNVLFDRIQNLIPKIILKKIYLLRTDHLELLDTSYKTIWSYAEKLLIGIPVNNSQSYILFELNNITDQLSIITQESLYTTEEIISIYAETLSYLKIDGYELVNPDELI